MRQDQKIYALAAVFCCLVAGPIQAGTCTSDDAMFQTKIDSITKKYEQKFDARRQQVEMDAEKIKDEVPKPNAVTGTLNFDIDIKWNIQEVKLHISEFKIKDKKNVI